MKFDRSLGYMNEHSTEYLHTIVSVSSDYKVVFCGDTTKLTDFVRQ